ncbi:MAG: hypothetical protein GY913_12065 [Proteobacteria bacterium]|nr:hypothetical protein [Pseudomonadota bacterium]MCP4917651.1 hypothetical protein [Pseudomonadota bacterium]
MWLLVSLASAFVPTCAAAPPPEVYTAGHHATWTGATIDWESEMRVRGSDEVLIIELASPMADDVLLVDATPGDLSAVRDETGRITALRVDRFAGDRVVVELSQPIRDELAAPLVDTSGLQRVTFDGMYFEPTSSAGLHRHLRYLAQPEVTSSERRALDKQLGSRATLSDHPMYLKADGRLAAGLTGEVRAVGERRAGVGLAAGSIFLGLMGGLALAYKMLARVARHEEDEAEKAQIQREREELRRELARGMR